MRPAAFQLLLALAACQPAHIRNGPIIIEDRQSVYVEPVDVKWLARQVDSLRLQRPEADAYEAVLAGDLRFWALPGGMSGEPPRVPGVESAMRREVVERFGVRTFRYTGEGNLSFPAGDSTLFRWLDVTMDYATRYNRERLRLRPLRH
jgi:8-oxo-dGTP pyrophosphatase MutT (NUDIX family)